MFARTLALVATGASIFAARLSLALPLREYHFERAEGNVTVTAEYDFIIAGGKHSHLYN